MFNITVVCQECEGTTRLWGNSDCWECDEGHKIIEENYETMEDAMEDYPNAVKIEEVDQAYNSDVPLVEDSVVCRQSDLKPFEWGTVERQLLELVNEKNIPDVHLAKDAGVSNFVISRWRSAQRRPNLQTLYKMSDYLGYKLRLVRDEY
jgi:hypothetical protein